jgi:hypothetical protein
MACISRPLDSERAALVASNAGRARAEALKYLRRHPWLEHHRGDLEAEARRGLVEGASRWEPRLGAFFTYCCWWIRSALEKYNRYGSRCVGVAKGERATWAHDVSLDTLLFDDGPTRGEVLATQEDAPPTGDSARIVAMLAQKIADAERSNFSSRMEPSAVASAWHRSRILREPIRAMAAEGGVSTQALHKRLRRVDALLESLAEQLKAETERL